MVVVLSTIFGSEINVGFQPHEIARTYSGYAGAHGLTAMHLGSRGHPLTITGTLRQGGNNYADARANLGTVISVIEAYLYAAAADYTFLGNSFYSIVFDRFQLLSGPGGKFFNFTSDGEVTCRFVMHARSLL